MAKRKSTTRGELVVDRAIPSIHIKTFREMGWRVISMSPKDNDLKDEPIAEKYGLGRRVLLTRDDHCHENNIKEKGKGFIGYIIIKQVSPQDLQTYNDKIKKDMTKLTNKNIAGKRFIVHVDKVLEKIGL